MFCKVESFRIHYKVLGSGDPVVLIHGWGASIDYFYALQKHLANFFTVYALDLPGFGLSSAPKEIIGSLDYAKIVAQFLEINNITNPILIGHSLGGKIIINLVAHNIITAQKIILISSAGVRLKPSLKLRIKILLYKLCKLILPEAILKKYRNKVGSSDYQNASGIMRKILVKTVNEDLTPVLSKIKIPTLLLWGDKDTSAPIEGGIIMQREISGAILKVFSGSGHFPFIDNYAEVVANIDKWLL